MEDISNTEIETLMAEYESVYTLNPNLLANGARRSSLVEAARIEIALRGFLE